MERGRGGRPSVARASREPQNCQYRNSLMPVSRIIDTAPRAAKSTIQAEGRAPGAAGGP